MAELHNAVTGYPKLIEAFRRAIGETSQGFTGLERAGETLTPTLDLWALPEWALLRGEVIYSRNWAVQAGGAGVFSSVEFVNPTGSGVLAVILQIKNVQGVAELSVDNGAALGAGAVTRGLANDTRWPNLGEVSRCSITDGAPVAGIALPQDVLAASLDVSNRPYIIRPGTKLFIISQSANVTIQGSFLWTERPLLAGEGVI